VFNTIRPGFRGKAIGEKIVKRSKPEERCRRMKKRRSTIRHAAVVTDPYGGNDGEKR